MAEYVQIPLERLKFLEEIEANLPKQIEMAIAEHKRNNLKRLHEKDKTDPKSVNIRVRRYAEKHKDEINAKRREKRRLKKLEEAKDAQIDRPERKKKEKVITHKPEEKEMPVNGLTVVDPSKRSITVRVTRVETPLPVTANTRDITVRFDE